MKLPDSLNNCSRVFIVCDRNVEGHLPLLELSCPTYFLEATEEKKTFETAVDICRWLMEHKADRSAFLIAFGGGVTSDITGFAASIFKRGIRYANIPTTLLSQVDAAIGGKTGVNLDGVKNMLGVIRQPEFIISCPELLSTLPQKEFLSGSAEMLKTFLLFSAPDYHKAVDELEKIRKGEATVSDNATLTELISKAANFKKKIVAEDPFEHGIRRILNLGHTFGHAIEWWQNQAAGRCNYTHGEAVAIGIIQASWISEKRGIAKAGLSDSLTADFRRCGLPTELPCSEEELQPAICQDKKNTNGNSRLVLLSDIAQPVLE